MKSKNLLRQIFSLKGERWKQNKRKERVITTDGQWERKKVEEEIRGKEVIRPMFRAEKLLRQKFSMKGGKMKTK